MESEPLDNSALRVIVRSIDDVTTLDNLAKKVDAIVIATKSEIQDLLTDGKKLEDWVRIHNPLTSTDPTLKKEIEQVKYQVPGKEKNFYYFKIPGLPASDPEKLAQLSLAVFLNVPDSKKLTLKAQVDLKMLFSNPRTFLRAEKNCFMYNNVTNLLEINSTASFKEKKSQGLVAYQDRDEFSQKYRLLTSANTPRGTPFLAALEDLKLNTLLQNAQDKISGLNNTAKILVMLAYEGSSYGARSGGTFLEDIIKLVNRVAIGDKTTGALINNQSQLTTNLKEITKQIENFLTFMESATPANLPQQVKAGGVIRNPAFDDYPPLKSLLNSTGPSKSKRPESKEFNEYLNSLTFLKGFAPGMYSYTDIEFYIPYFKDNIKEVVPITILNLKILFALNTHFIVDLFSIERFTQSNTRQFFQATTIENLLFFIEEMAFIRSTNQKESIDALLLFICRCLRSFVIRPYNAQDKVLGSGGARKAISFLLRLMNNPKLKEGLKSKIFSNVHLANVYAESVAQGISDVSNINYEQMQVAPGEIIILPGGVSINEDLSIHLFRSFAVEFFADDKNESAIQAATMIRNQVMSHLFKNDALCEKINPNFIVFCFNFKSGTKTPLINKMELFKLIWSRPFNQSDFTLDILNLLHRILTEANVLKHLPLDEFLTYFGSLNTEEMSSLKEISNLLYQFFKKRELGALDEVILKSFSESKLPEVQQYQDLKSNPTHYHLNLYFQLVQFSNDISSFLRIEYLNDKEFFSQAKREMLEYIMQRKSKETRSLNEILQEKTVEMNLIVNNLSLIEQILTYNQNSLKNQYDWYESMVKFIKDKKSNILSSTLNEIQEDPVFKTGLALLVEKVDIWGAHKVLVEYTLFRDSLKEVVESKGGSKISFEHYFDCFVSERTRHKAEFLKFKDPSLITMAKYKKYFPSVPDPLRADCRLSIRHENCELEYFKVMFNLDIAEEDIEEIIKNIKVLYTANKLLKLNEIGTDSDLKKLAEKKDAADKAEVKSNYLKCVEEAIKNMNGDMEEMMELLYLSMDDEKDVSHLTNVTGLQTDEAKKVLIVLKENGGCINRLATSLGIKEKDKSMKDQYCLEIQELCSHLSGLDRDKITAKNVIDKDITGIAHVKDHELFESKSAFIMPALVKHMSNSRETVLFIKQKADEFIKTMNDEVDEENMELINQLDKINKSLKFAAAERTFEGVVKKLAEIDLALMRDLKIYLERVERMMIFLIKPLAEKTKGGDNHVKNVMRCMLLDSKYRVFYNEKHKAFMLEVKYHEKISTTVNDHSDIKDAKYTELKQFELEEFVNRSKVITVKLEDQEDPKKADTLQFSRLGTQLENLCINLQRLRDIGLILSKLRYLLCMVNKNSSKPDFNLSEDETTMVFEISGTIDEESEYKIIDSKFEFLIEANETLSKLCNTATADLVKYFDQRGYLMTFFTGKKFFYLTEYFRSKQGKMPICTELGKFEEEQIKFTITEVFKGKSIDFSANHLIPEDMTMVVEAVYKNMKDWTAAVYTDSKDQGSNQTEGSEVMAGQISSTLPGRKVKVCNSTITGENKDKYEEMNDYLSMMKVIAKDKNRPVPYLSQILLCTQATTRMEIYSFLSRALLDKYQNFYFIFNANIDNNALSTQLLADMKAYIGKLSDAYKKNLNYNLLIFTNKEEQFKEDVFVSMTVAIHNFYLKKAHEENLKLVSSTFATSLNKINVVTSKQAGMGKTTVIKRKWNDNFSGRKLYEIFFSGEMTMDSINSRIKNLTKECKKSFGEEGRSEIFGLVIKLDTIEDFEAKKHLLDYLMFTLSIVQSFQTEIGVLDLTKNCQSTFIEISNMHLDDPCNTLQFLSALKALDRVADISAGIQDIYLEVNEFRLEDVEHLDDTDSNQQELARYLHELYQGKPPRSTVNKQTFIDLLKLFYLQDPWAMDCLNTKEPWQNITNNKQAEGSSFSQYQFWMRTVVELAKSMDKSQDFKKGDESTGTKSLSLRQCILGEILSFASQITNASIKEAKLSQKKTIEALIKLKAGGQMDKNLLKKEKDAIAIDLANSLGWSSDNLIVPLLFGDSKKPLFAHKCYDASFINSSTSANAKKKLKKYIETSKAYVNTNPGKFFDSYTSVEKAQYLSAEYMKQLSAYLGQDLKDLEGRIQLFQKSKGFVITQENYMKMCLMIVKAHLKIPIVIMGESGCGKTYLTRFVSTCLLQDEMKELTLYSGVTEQDFVDTMREAIKKANMLLEDAKKTKNKPKNLWMFFDEFNTSSLQSIVAEIMIDRVCSIDESIEDIPDNMVFVGCCNPYRLKTKNTDIGLVPSSSSTILSHRVYPIPERVLNYVWDFGQLKEEDELKHVQSMVDAEKLFEKGYTPAEKKELTANFVNMVYGSHKKVRDIEERSGVSLRDISRVITLFDWFRKIILELEEIYPDWEKNPIKDYYSESKTKPKSLFPFPKREIWMRAAACSVFVTYGLRLNGRKEDQLELKRVMKTYYTEVVKSASDSKHITDNLELLARMYLDKISKKTSAIPPSIAINRPLMENFITMLACYDTCTPLIICGAPGTSKTLCSQIFDSAMISAVIKTNAEFSKFKPIYSLYYGGSETSTAEGITRVYKRAEYYKSKKGEDRPVVIFDEIGLAELSPHNPLKVLHPLLEDPESEIGFFGISNWTLDLSKMNRLIYLARPDMDLEDLKQIFSISIKDCNPEHKQKLKDCLDILAKSYLSFRSWQKISGSHPNFHGSRDVYSVAKFIYNRVRYITKPHHTVELIKNAIERNFNGTAYLLTDDNYYIQEKDSVDLKKTKLYVAGLSDAEDAGNKSLKGLRLDEIGSAYNYDATKKRDEHPVANAIFTSSQVFKQIFLNTLKTEDEKQRLDGFTKQTESSQIKFMSEVSSMHLIEENLLDPTARFLLVKSEGEVVDNMFMAKLYEVSKNRRHADEIKDWRGIKGKENSIELLTTLKSYISLGYLVVMKNLDELYGSLYDLFNQKYSQIEDKKYCFLYFGQNKHRVEVHDNFKAVVIIEAEEGREDKNSKDIEIAQPAPFLNRFEKFFVSLANLQRHDRDVQFIYDIVSYLQQVIKTKHYRFIGISVDMIASIQTRCREKNMAISALNDEVKRKLFRLATTNLLLRENLSKADLNMFEDEHPFQSLKEAVTSKFIISTAPEFFCIFTFSNPIEFKQTDVLSDIEDQYTLFTDEELITQGLEKRSVTLKHLSSQYLVVQFTSMENLTLVSQLKSSIKGNANLKKCMFLLHVQQRSTNDLIQLSKNYGLNYWGGWENYVIENIHQTNYKNLKEMYSMDLSAAFFQPDALVRGSSIAVLRSLVERTLVKLVMDTNDQTLIDNLNSIKKMLIEDEDNVYISKMIDKLKNKITLTREVRSAVSDHVENSKDKLGYIDLEVAMVDMMFSNMRAVSDTVRRHLQLTNNTLTNLASYAIYYNYDENESIRKQFRDEFAINTLDFTDADLREVTHKYTCYRVPFLKKECDRFFSEFSSRMTDPLVKESIEHLIENFNEYLVKSQTKGKNDQLKAHLDQIRTVETQLENSTKPIIDNLYNKISTRDSIIQEEILADIATNIFRNLRSNHSGASINKQKMMKKEEFISLLERKLPFFKKLCKELNTVKSQPNPEDHFRKHIILLVILVMGFQPIIEEIFGLLDIIAKKPGELFDDLIVDVGREDEKESRNPDTELRFEYTLLERMRFRLQLMAVPDFNEGFDLTKSRYTFTSLLAKCGGNSSSVKFIVILLNMLGCLGPADFKSNLSTIRETQNQLKFSASKMDYHDNIKSQWILPMFHQVRSCCKSASTNIEGVASVFCDYFVACAEMFDFSDFLAASKQKEGIGQILADIQEVLAEAKDTKIEQIDTEITDGRDRVEKLGYSKVNLYERIGANLANFLSRKLFDDMAPLTDYDAIQHLMQKVDEEESQMKTIELALINKLDPKSKLHEMFLLTFGDNLFYRWVESTELNPDTNWLEILQKLNSQDHYELNKTNYSLKIVITAAAIRVVVNKILSKQYSSKEEADIVSQNLFLDLEDPDSFFSELHRLPTIYFMQKYIGRAGMSGPVQTKFEAVDIKKEEIIDTGNCTMIVSFNKQFNQDIIDLTEMLSSATFDLEGVSTRLQKMSSKGNRNIEAVAYMAGVAIINAAAKLKPEENGTNHNEAIKMITKKLIELGWNDEFRTKCYGQLLVNMVQRKKLEEIYSPSGSKEIGVTEKYDDEKDLIDMKSRIVFYQFALMMVCFSSKSPDQKSDTNTGYDLSFIEEWARKTNGELPQEQLQIQLVSSRKLDNMTSIYQLTIVERLSDGSYQDYGEELPKNLGIYKCVCNYVYSIGQCGYAIVLTKCPICQREIGGYGHKSINEPIETLADLRKILLQVYEDEKKGLATNKDELASEDDKKSVKGCFYLMHPLITNQTPELIPLKLMEMPNIDDMRSYLTKEPTVDMRYEIYDKKIRLRHLWDHLLIMMAPELLEKDRAKKFRDSLEKMRKTQIDPVKELNPTLKSLHNSTHYVSLHVRADMEALSTLTEESKTLDYIKALHSKIADEFILKEESKLGNNIPVDPQYLKSSKTVMIEQQDVIDSMRKDQGQANLEKIKALKVIFYNRDLNKLNDSEGKTVRLNDSFSMYYKLLRHNENSSSSIQAKFFNALQNSKGFMFLKRALKYKSLLQEYPHILESNVGIVNYMKVNYERAFAEEDAKNRTIEELIAGPLAISNSTSSQQSTATRDVKLENRYNDFKVAWGEKINKYNSMFPEVFTFSFDCRKDLAVQEYVESILAKGKDKKSAIIKFLLLEGEKDSLMRAIIQSLVKNFHNKRVEEMGQILYGTSEVVLLDSKKLESCRISDYVMMNKEAAQAGNDTREDDDAERNTIKLNPRTLEEIVMQNFWMGRTTADQNEIYFDFHKIQYELAMSMFKPYIKAESTELPYFQFLGSNQEAMELKIEKFVSNIKSIPLTQGSESAILDMQDKLLQDSYDFILEMGNYAASNYLVNQVDSSLQEIITEVPDKSFTRFNNYKMNIHGHYKLGQLGEVYYAHKKAILYKSMEQHKAVFGLDMDNTKRNELESLLVKTIHDKEVVKKLLHHMIQHAYRELSIYKRLIKDSKQKQGADYNNADFDSLKIFTAMFQSTAIESYNEIRERDFESIVDNFRDIKLRNGRYLSEEQVTVLSKLELSQFYYIKDVFDVALNRIIT